MISQYMHKCYFIYSHEKSAVVLHQFHETHECQTGLYANVLHQFPLRLENELGNYA